VTPPLPARGLATGRWRWAETVFWLVPPEESNPMHGRVSTDSPLGRAVLGTRPGDEVRFRAPGGVKVATVVAVER